jgi:hypothetical protein
MVSDSSLDSIIASIGLGVLTVRGSAGSWVGTNERQAGPKRSSNCLANCSETIAHESNDALLFMDDAAGLGDVSSHFGAVIKSFWSRNEAPNAQRCLYSRP